MVLSGDGWTRGSVFECKRCHQGVLQSGGSCVYTITLPNTNVDHYNNDEKSTPGNTKQNIAKRDGSAEELDRETGEEQTTVGRTHRKDGG